MEQDRIKKLKILMDRHGIADVYYENGNDVVHQTTAAAALGQITSPFAGLFFARHPMAKPQLSGETVRTTGEMIGFIKSGLLLRPIIDVTGCHLSDAKISDGTQVNFEQPVYDVSG